MIILERDGSLLFGQFDGCELVACEELQAVFDIPAPLVLRHDTLIDQLIDYAFDVLGLQAVELRVYEE